MKKKLLFIVNVDWFFVSHRLPIALEAINQGYEVHLTCASTGLDDYLTSLGIIIHPLRLTRSELSILAELKSMLQMFGIVRAIDPDIIHTITIKPVLYGNLIARLLRVKSRVVSISGLGYVFIADGVKGSLLRLLSSFFYRVALKGAYKVIFQNQSDRDVLRRLKCVTKYQEVLIRGSGVDLDKFQPTLEPNGKPVVMFVGRFLIDKGINEFVAAAVLLKKARPDVRMVLVGSVDSANRKSILEEELDYWIRNRVIEYWGQSDDMSSTLSQSNIVVLPSYREGLPKALIEAAACGRAIVTTDVPGCRDAIEPNITGLLVPVKSCELLAEAILMLIDDSAFRLDLAANGRKLAETVFDIKDVINKHLDIYDKKEFC